MDTSPQTFACLGFEYLGRCEYNPSSPANLYFSLGEVVGALAFTLAAQQLLRQVIIFRLSARHMTLRHIYFLVFAGVLASIIAAIVPNLPFLHASPLGFAINWEILATILFVFAYAAVVQALVVPVRVKATSIEAFARGAVRLLSSADEADQADFTLDLQRSLSTFIEAAAFDAHVHSTTAFYDFRFRSEIRSAAYAGSFLTIIADPAYCRTLITRQPWRIAEILRQVSQDQLHCRQAEQFIRELAHQAIVRDDSMMTREIGFHGFSHAPFLSDALFSDYFIVRQYNPLNSFFTASGEQITPMLLKRFNSAAERCYKTLIDNGEYRGAQAAFSIQSYYRSVFMRAGQYQTDRTKGFDVPLEMHHAVRMATRLANRLLAKVSAEEYDQLYVQDATQYRHDVLETLVEIVYEALNGISNKFSGYDDVFWIMAIGVTHDIFHSTGQQPDGITPFQQRLILKIVGKLKDNMNGLYPAILRVMLAAVGPYKQQASQPNRTAYNILKDAMYIVLRQLPKLANKKPRNISDYFLTYIAYNVETNSITHTYRGGSTVRTDLSALDFPALSLIKKSLHRRLTAEEIQSARTDI